MARELPKVYEPQQVETEIYKMWEGNGYFRPSNKEGAKPFTIVIPCILSSKLVSFSTFVFKLILVSKTFSINKEHVICRESS